MGLLGRRPSRDVDIFLMDLMNRFEMTMSMIERGKLSAKEITSELERMRKMLMVLRHQIQA